MCGSVYYLQELLVVVQSCEECSAAHLSGGGALSCIKRISIHPFSKKNRLAEDLAFQAVHKGTVGVPVWQVVDIYVQNAEANLTG